MLPLSRHISALELEEFFVERERRSADPLHDRSATGACRHDRQRDDAVPADVHHELSGDLLGDAAPACRTARFLDGGPVVPDIRKAMLDEAQDNRFARPVLEASRHQFVHDRNGVRRACAPANASAAP